MKPLLLIISLILTATSSLAHSNWPRTKFQPGDCIIGTNPDADTYQKIFEIYDIRLSKRFSTVMYIYWEKTDNKQDGRAYQAMDIEFSKLSRCP